MLDPQSNDLIAKTIGEVSGKFIEKSFDLGNKFIKRYFKNHKENVKEQADKNALEFLELLSYRVSQLEQSLADTAHKKQIEATFDSPDFSKILEQSIKISSLSQDKEKKLVLSELIVQRLFLENETTESLIVKIACEKIEYLNNNHLKLLGLTYAVHTTAHFCGYKATDRAPFTDAKVNEILLQRFSAYYNIVANQTELQHLEFHNCIKINPGLTAYLSPLIMPPEIGRNFGTEETTFYQTSIGRKLAIDWAENNLQKIAFTIVGEHIAYNVYNILQK